jgi:hypothetical protein
MLAGKWSVTGVDDDNYAKCPVVDLSGLIPCK